MSPESPLVIPGPDGVPIFAILHEPERPRRPRTGINLLNPGLKSRVAPNRLNVLQARRLAALGYFVLRMDPPGVGDSGGSLPEDPLPDLWQQVQRGAFVEAVRAASGTFATSCQLEEVVGMGNCGGAISALLAAEADPRVRRLVLVDVPVTLVDTDPNAAAAILGRRHGARVLGAYLKRVASWRAWLRLLTLQSDLKTIGRALWARFFDAGGRTRGEGPARDEATDGGGAPAANAGSLSPLFVRGFMDFHERGGQALFVHAGDYSDTFLFEQHFGEPHMRPGTPLAERHRRITIAGANHVYGDPAWRDQLFEAVESWLEATSAPLAAPPP